MAAIDDDVLEEEEEELAVFVSTAAPATDIEMERQEQSSQPFASTEKTTRDVRGLQLQGLTVGQDVWRAVEVTGLVATVVSMSTASQKQEMQPVVGST